METHEKIIVTIVTFLLILGIALPIYYEVKHPCIEYHQEEVHHDQWIQYIFINKVQQMIIHPAYDAIENVCDKRKN